MNAEKYLELFDFFYENKRIAAVTNPPTANCSEINPEDAAVFTGDPSPPDLGQLKQPEATPPNSVRKKAVARRRTTKMSLGNAKQIVPLSIEDMYEITKARFSKGFMQEISDKLEYIEVNLKFIMEEFSFFSALRINYKPHKVSQLRATFFSSPNNQFVEAYVGKIKSKEQANELLIDGTKMPEANSIYEICIRFDKRLIRAIEVEGVQTVADFMNNVPLCC